MIRPKTLPFFLLFVLLLSSCSFSLAEDILPPPGSEQLPASQPRAASLSGPLYPLVPPEPEAGRSIFSEKCAPCHGVAGQGDGPQAAQLPNPVAAIGSLELARQSTPADWYTQVTQGNLEKFMPPFNSLSDRQRWDVIAYSFSLSTPDEVLEQGASLYEANCARCHGAQGHGDGPDASALSRPVLDFTDQSWMAQKSAADFYQAITNGVAPEMPAFASDVSEDDRWALTAFLRSLSFAVQGEPVAAGTTAPALTPEPGVTSEPGATAGPEDQGTSASATQAAQPASGVGTIGGTVTNASGSVLPDDLEVSLRGFDDMQVAITQTTTLQPDGTYLFADVDMPTGRVFMVTVDYNQATYGSDIGMVEAGITSLDLPVTVYETTTDASILKADRLHLFFEFVDAQTVRVIELYIVSNPTDKTLVAPESGGPTIQFRLPEGATGLEFQDGALGGRYLETPDGFADTMAIRPGEGSYEALYSYLMPYDKKLDLKLSMTMPVDAAVVLVPEGDINIKSDVLQDSGSRDVQGTQYHSYTGSSLKKDDELTLTLTGHPTTAAPSLTESSNTGLIVGLSAFGLTLVLTGAWLYKRSRTVEPDAEIDEDQPESPAAAYTENRETLMDAIIALDDLFQAGQLPEEAYRKRRAELKERLVELSKN